METFDRELLAAIGKPRPRVAVVPAAPTRRGEETLRRWAELGRQHFEALGAEVETVVVRSRAEADDPASAQAVGEADLIYVSGGRPHDLLAVLAGSQTWEAARRAHQRGAILVGCAAGAMVLGGHCLDMRRRLGWPVRWELALDVIPGAAVTPWYDGLPEPLRAFVILQAPRDTVVLGIDRETAVVGRDGAWQVRGSGRVTVWRGRRRTRHRAGDVIRL